MRLRSVLAWTFVSFAATAPVSYVTAVRAQSVDAYCAKMGDDDRVKAIPPGLVPRASKLFGSSSDGSGAWVQKNTVFRCMSGQVWLCNYGANLTCAKADVSRVSKGAEAYCKENPGSDLVPMAATGHATIHTWECVGRKARIKSSEKLDPRGFIANQWERSAQKASRRDAR
jgi:hypothetical protein